MLLLLLALGLLTVSNALDNGVGRTPPMGWSSWQMFNRFVNETDIAESILALSSLKEFGYEYANFDGAWMSPERDPASNRQVANPATVPHGIKALADLAHANGIKFGLYSAVGNVTCQGNPGSWGFEQLDADQYAEWGVDYLKIDSCGGIPGLPGVDAQRLGFERMRDALNKTGRQVFINTCGMYGVSAQQEANKPSACTAPGETGWAYTNDVDGWRGQSHLVANSWLVEWANNLNSFFQAPCGRGWLTVLDANEDLTEEGWSGPGGWNDMDIMSVGCSDAEKARGHTHTDCNNGNQTVTEQASQFALWCMKSAPIILGGDLRRLSPEIKAIITNKEMIALDQDPLGIPARIVWQASDEQEADAAQSARTLMEVRPCNASDPYQHWSGAALSSTPAHVPSPVSNAGAAACLTTTWNDPVTVKPCGGAGDAIFMRNNASCPGAAVGAITLEVVKGPGDGGYGGRCLDLNHGTGPDVDLWACHQPDHPDCPHQVFDFAPLAAADGGDAVKGLLHVSNASSGSCLGLYGSIAPADRTLTIFSKKLYDRKRPRAVALFNRGGEAANMTLKREHLLLETADDCPSVSLRDLEAHEMVATGLTGLGALRTVEVASHQTVVWLVGCA